MIVILRNGPALEVLGMTLDLGVLITYGLVLLLAVVLVRYVFTSL